MSRISVDVSAELNNKSISASLKPSESCFRAFLNWLRSSLPCCWLDSNVLKTLRRLIPWRPTDVANLCSWASCGVCWANSWTLLTNDGITMKPRSDLSQYWHNSWISLCWMSGMRFSEIAYDAYSFERIPSWFWSLALRMSKSCMLFDAIFLAALLQMSYWAWVRLPCLPL